MAKRKNDEVEVETNEDAPKKGGRKIMLTLEDGTEIPRVDYIRKRWTEDKLSRRQITDEVSELQGKEVAYQIIFAATKGIEGGPDPVEKEAETAEDTAEDEEAA